jgi:CRISPR system Cascade subunit CasE
MFATEMAESFFRATLLVDPAHPLAKKDLGDRYQLHRTLSRAFYDPRADAGESGEQLTAARLLFRIEPQESHAQVVLVSRVRPNIDNLLLPSGYLLEKPVLAKITPRFADGQALRFAIHARPASGKPRIALKTPGEAIGWICRKLESAGAFCLEADPMPFMWLCSKNGHRAERLPAVDFRGGLRVADSERFAKSLPEGIGPSKCYGFGLLDLSHSPSG